MILAIDDDPGRYDHLARLLSTEIQVAACTQCVMRLLPRSTAVLLDHDLNSGYCLQCGQKSDLEDSRPFVPLIQVPTIVTSASMMVNRKWLVDHLTVPCAQISAISIDPELSWIGWLYLQGVLS